MDGQVLRRRSNYELIIIIICARSKVGDLMHALALELPQLFTLDNNIIALYLNLDMHGLAFETAYNRRQNQSGKPDSHLLVSLRLSDYPVTRLSGHPTVRLFDHLEWPRSVGARENTLRKSLNSTPPMSFIMIDKEMDKLVGHARLCPLLAISQSCWIESVIISSDLRGKGLGRCLMAQLEDEAKKFGFKSENKQAFYAKCGYLTCEPVFNVGANTALFKRFNLERFIGTNSSTFNTTCMSAPLFEKDSACPSLHVIRNKMKNTSLILLFQILLSYFLFLSGYPSKIPIKTYIQPDEENKGIMQTIQQGEMMHNNNENNPFKFSFSNRQLHIDEIDTWNLMNIVCDDLKVGVMVIMCGNMGKPYEAFLAMAENMEIPLINWDLSPVFPAEEARNFFQVSIRPPTAELIADLILYKQWPSFMYLHDGKNSIINFQWIFYYLHRKSNISISAEMLRIPQNEDDFLEFFQKLNTNRLMNNSAKRNDSLFRQNFRHGQLYSRGYPGIYCHPSMDLDNPHRPFTTFEHGQLLARALRGIRLDSNDDILSGHIEFDRFGMRKNFDVTVIDLVSNIKSAFNRKEINRHKKVLKVVTIVTAPFVMVKRGCEGETNKSGCDGNDRYEGFCIDLLKLLSDKIEDFKKYEIILAKGNKYGIKQPDGSWDGLIGSLLSGEADVCVASLTINQDRERVVDFSKPFMTTGISIMIKKPDKQEFSVFSFMQPLSTEIWMYIIFAYVGVSVVIFLVSRFSPYEWRIEEMSSGGGFTISNDFSVYNCLWYTLAAFMQQGTDIVPRSISGRLASSVWWFFTMIIVSSYTANLAAFLTLEKMQAPIESVEDLAKQTKIKYGIQQGGSTAQFLRKPSHTCPIVQNFITFEFQHSSVQIYQRMWRYMESQVPAVFTSTYAEGIERVRSHKGRYAFWSNLNSVGYGVATPFGSPYKDHINLAILALQERGELKKLENKWWYDRGECDQGIADGHNASLNLSKVAGIFYILMGGMIASMLAALGEFLYRSRIEARKGNVTSLLGSLAENLRGAFFPQPKKILQDDEIFRKGTPVFDVFKKQDDATKSSDSKSSKITDELIPAQPFIKRYNTAV
ncbi:AMPA receptor subunit GluR3A [Dirofilaria immitis]|nr:AMPA receptor subunit GluR3A [Dirofilaria immitis]